MLVASYALFESAVGKDTKPNNLLNMKTASHDQFVIKTFSKRKSLQILLRTEKDQASASID